MAPKGKTIGELKVGDCAETSRTITEHDVYTFAGLSGDLNPAHIDQEYAKGTFFKTRIAHGLISAGLVSAVLGMQLPGPGTIWLTQVLNFKAPVRIGDTITARVEVAEIMEKSVRLKTTCTNQEGVVVLDGEALVSPPRK